MTTELTRRHRPIDIQIDSVGERRSLVNQCKKLSGKRIIIKYGGAAFENEELKRPTLQDIALLKEAGASVVLIHGGSRRLNQEMLKRGLEPKMIKGLRYTPPEVIQMASKVFGQLNDEIVVFLDAEGAYPVGIRGEKSKLIKARIKDFNLYGCVGDVEEVNVNILLELLSKKKLPVISGLGADDRGQILNINLDTVAAAVAGALSADKFMLITDVDGILRDVKNPSTRIATLNRDQLKSLQSSNVVANGMLPKIEACIYAMDQDVKETYVISCRQPHALITELLGNTHYGTHIMR